MNVLLVFYKKLSQMRQTERRWQDCFRVSEQRWWRNSPRQWQCAMDGNQGHWKLTTGDYLMSTCWQSIVLSHTDIITYSVYLKQQYLAACVLQYKSNVHIHYWRIDLYKTTVTVTTGTYRVDHTTALSQEYCHLVLITFQYCGGLAQLAATLVGSTKLLYG